MNSFEKNENTELENEVQPAAPETEQALHEADVPEQTAAQQPTENVHEQYHTQPQVNAADTHEDLFAEKSFVPPHERQPYCAPNGYPPYPAPQGNGQYSAPPQGYAPYQAPRQPYYNNNPYKQLYNNGYNSGYNYQSQPNDTMYGQPYGMQQDPPPRPAAQNIQPPPPPSYQPYHGYTPNTAPQTYEIPAVPPLSDTAAKKKKSGAGIIIIAIVSILLVCAVMIGIAVNADKGNNASKLFSAPENVKVEINVAPKPSSDPLDYQDMERGLYTTTGAVKHVLPSIVSLYSYTSSAIAPASGASGIIISDDGYIITNSHAVDDANRVKVRLSDEREFEAKVIGKDTRTDLAVLKINASDLTPAVIGSSSELEQGEMVIAIGNAGGFNDTVTVGYVSHPSRELKSYTGYPVTYIQTDAALNFGNSGGALINLYGQVVGIVNSKFSGSDGLENLGFCIASDFAVPICEDIISQGYVTGRPRIGIIYTQITVEQAEKLEVEAGLLISEISEECDISNTTLRPDDIITEIDGEKMLTAESIKKFQNTHKAGDMVTAKVYRKSITGEESEFEITFRLEEDK